jgi:hypothetical protein
MQDAAEHNALIMMARLGCLQALTDTAKQHISFLHDYVKWFCMVEL